MDRWDLIIVGAGIAGLTAADEFHRLQPAARVLLINAEADLPYKRTKLSKTLTAPLALTEFLLRPEAWFDETGIDLMPETRVARIDPVTRTVALEDGSELGWQHLLLATGSAPRYPPHIRHHDRSEFYLLRDRGDALRLSRALTTSQSVLVSGMGVLGVEVAEQARALGKRVHLLGSSAQLLPRHLNLRGAELLDDLLRKRGIDLHYQEDVLSYERSPQGTIRATTVQREFHVDRVVFCQGTQPELALARSAGLAINRGVLVDAGLRTSVAGIWAAGDVAEHPDGSVTHLWHAAEDQGLTAGRSIAGEPVVWQDPGYRLKCQVFDGYFFSLWNPRRCQTLELKEFELGRRYLGAWLDGDLVQGLVMVNDKERAPGYESAVHEHWTWDSLLSWFHAGR